MIMIDDAAIRDTITFVYLLTYSLCLCFASFSAFDQRTRSARELLRQVQAQRFAKANPNLKINIDIHDLPSRPVARFTMVDGTEQVFETHENTVNDMLFQVHLKTMKLDAEFELEGKSVDEI
jgi:hypothetical protein